MAKLFYMGHALMDNRHGLAVSGRVTGIFMLNLIAYNLERIPKLAAA